MHPWDFPSTSVNSQCGRGTFRQLPSNFRAPARSFVYFCQIALRQASVNFLYYCASMHSVSLCQLYACPQDHLSIFRVSEGHSVNFHQFSMRPRVYLSNFVSAEHFVIFSKLSVHPHYLPSNFRATAGPSVNFLCVCTTFRQLPSSFHVSAGPYVNLISTFRASEESSVIFRALTVPSVNFVNFPWLCGTIRQLPSNFRGSTGSSVNIPCICGTFHELSMRPRDLCQHFVLV